MSTEFELFKGTNFSDLMRDIYHNSKKKSRQIDSLIKNLEPMIKNTGDATVVVPMIKDYLEVSVKNDDALVELAAVVQRIISANSKDDDGNERFIASSSRLFTTAERNYSTFKKEVVSVLAGLSSFDSLLRFAKKLVLYVDARSMLFLRAVKASSPILMRFALAISTYELEIIHIPGKDHILPDILSRSLEPNCEPPVSPMSEQEATTILEQLTLPDGFKINKETLEPLEYHLFGTVFLISSNPFQRQLKFPLTLIH